ncbi:MAG: sterol desaturase family protein [Bacteroidota bacterium]
MLFNILINAGIVLATFIIMEVWAWIMHRYILHGPLWFIHRTHHRYNPTWWEWNDVVSILYGLISMGLVVYGLEYGSRLLWVGVGIAVYGTFYFIFHDIIIHRRVKIRFSSKNPYINRLIRAHKMHHKHPNRDESEAYGFLYAIKKYQTTPKAKVKS